MNTPVNRPPYPHLLLPDAIRDPIVEGQQVVQAPMAQIATAALSAISLACQGIAEPVGKSMQPLLHDRRRQE
jgi:hypothetical protein